MTAITNSDWVSDKMLELRIVFYKVCIAVKLDNLNMFRQKAIESVTREGRLFIAC